MRPADLDPAAVAATSLPGRSEPLRVVFLADQLTGKGMEETWGALIERLNPARFDVEICSLGRLGVVGERLARRFPATSPLRRHACDARGLARLARHLRGRADAVVTLGGSGPMWWGVAAARWSKIPVALSLLDEANGAETLGFADRVVARWSDGIVVPTEAGRRRLVDERRLPTASVHMIAPGVDTDRFNFRPADAFQVRQQLEIPERAALCGLLTSADATTARQMLDGVRRVAFSASATRFVIWGPASLSLNWSAWISAAGLQDRVFVLDDHDNWKAALSAMQVLACWGATPSLRLLEAMAAQVPIVATDHDGIQGLVQPGCHGYLVESQDLRAWASLTIQLLQDASLARGLGECGRQHVVKYGSIDVMVRRYEQLIYETHQRKRSGPGAADAATLVDGVEFCGAAP